MSESHNTSLIQGGGSTEPQPSYNACGCAGGESSTADGLALHQRVAPILTSSDEAKKNYNSLAWIYDTWSCWERPYLRAGLETLHAQCGEHIMEIGCGTGALLLRLAEAVGATGNVIGVDISEKMLAKASQRVEKARAKQEKQPHKAPIAPIHLLLADISNPFDSSLQGRGYPKEGSLDAVVLTFTMELFPVDVAQRVLAEIRRLLVPGTGRLCIVSMSALSRKKPRKNAAPEEGPPKSCMTRMYERCHKWFPQHSGGI